MSSHRLVVVPVIATLLLSASSAFAQPDPLNLPTNSKAELAPLDAAAWRAIQTQNVPPSLIAWQLDAEHNAMPAFLNVPYMPPPNYAADYKAPARVKGPFDLPDNVRLAASDERNLLFVADADAAQIARLQELVSILDQPLRYVELEAQMVELPIADLGKFGLFDAATPGAFADKTPVKSAMQIGFVRENYQQRIDALVAAGVAKVISTQPQTTINNMGVAISMLSGRIDNTGANQNQQPVAPAGGSDTVITLTPTINGDDTITVLMRLTTLPTTAADTGLVTIANLRDGDTIALTGLKTSAFPGTTTNNTIPLLGDTPPGLFRSNTSKDDAEERAVLVFITARILRGDKN